MALTYAFKQSLKRRKRWSRRMEVLLFLGLAALGLVEGAHPLTWNNLGIKWLPYVFAVTRVYTWWRAQRVITVGSLDDRAMLEHGVTFDQLAEPEQKSLLRRYQVGTYVMNFYPDEREQNVERESAVHAYALLRRIFPILAVVYWLGWRLLPPGELRDGWTDGPAVLTWTFLLVLALPEMLRLWTEPDPIPEPRIVATEA